MISATANTYLSAVDLIYYEETDPNDEDAVEDLRIGLIWAAFSLAFAGLSIFAATTYNKLVLIGGVYLIIENVAASIMLSSKWQQPLLDYVGIAVFLLFAYPHFGLFLALKKGTISRETWEREKYCCCRDLAQLV